MLEKQSDQCIDVVYLERSDDFNMCLFYHNPLKETRRKEIKRKNEKRLKGRDWERK